MNITLQIRHSLSSQRRPAAWFLAGGSAAEWLDEIARWPTAHESLQLIIVAGESHGSVSGVLVIVETEGANAIQDSQPLGVPYGSIGGRLFVPMDAEFDPPAADAEVAALLPDDRAIYVWQPARGLIRCDTSDQTDVGRFLTVPPAAMETWDRAVPGVVLNDRLISIEPKESLDAQQILQEARGDIAMHGESLADLPYSPQQIQSFRRMLWLGLAVAGILVVAVVVMSFLNGRRIDWRLLLLALGVAVVAFLLFRQFLKWAKETAAKNRSGGRRSDTGGGIGSWLREVRSWVAERASAIDEQLEALRHREIGRLLHMLDARPDEGLRYAIPMTSGMGRGVAARGSRLIERLVEFSLGRLGGAGASDYWGISYEYQMRLTTKYRELANREIALGRHRRAAYILAELLGDLRAAAATLADGGYFREAAALYDQRLKDPRAAAQCLERGGLLSEAIIFYHGFGDHHKVGELYEKMQQWDLAEQAFRRAAVAKLERGDYLGSAQLWENKLHQPEQALQILRRGWPDSPQASLCLEESFKLLARQAAHDQASHDVTSLAAEFRSSDQLVACFARISQTYPDANVRLLVADQTRVLAAHQLNSASAAIRHSLLQAVQQLAPEDRLLARDCARFEHPPFAKPPRGPRPADSESIRVAYEFRLAQEKWNTVIAVQDEFYAAGYRGNELLLVRGRFDGTLHQPADKPWLVDDRYVNDHPILMGTSDAPGTKIILQVPLAGPVPYDRTFPGTDWFGERTAGGHPSLDQTTLGLNVTPWGIVHTFTIGPQGFVLSLHLLLSGKFLNSMNCDPTKFELDEESPSRATVPVSVAPVDRKIVIALGRQLVGVTSSSTVSTPLPCYATAIGSARKSEPFLVLLESGAMIWLNGGPFESSGIHFADELSNPVGCRLGTDFFVVADQSQIQTYKRAGKGLRMIACKKHQCARPIALLRAKAINKAALFCSDGKVLIYEFR